MLEIELKDKLSLGNILLVPDIINSKLIVIIFVEVKSVISNILLKKLKETINSKTSKSIPIVVKIEESKINYLRCGRINRSFYKEKYLEYIN